MEGWNFLDWASIAMGISWILIGIQQLAYASRHQDEADEQRLARIGATSRYNTRWWEFSQRTLGFIMIGLGISHLLLWISSS